MPDTPTPALAGAQNPSDANPIDAIIDSAETEATKESPESQPSEPEVTETKEQNPELKKAWNALSHEKGKTAKWRESAKQERAERERLATELEKYRAQPSQPNPKPANTGEPSEKDFQNYHEYMRAVQKYDLAQEISKLEGKQTENQRAAQDDVWTKQQMVEIKAQSDKLAADIPDYQSVFEEHLDIVDEFSPQIQRAFLEAGELAPVAFYNLAKEGKLEALASMSPARAAIEIGRAASQAPVKPKTKAPPPLTASRGSVPGGKSLDSMSGDELLKWVKT